MNTQIVPPPEYDIPPATSNRQRDELIAIVDHESAQATPRRRLVPLLAAAAVVAVTAGLAIGVPALRGDKAQPAVSGSSTGAAAPAVEPLTVAEKAKYLKLCHHPLVGHAPSQAYVVTDAFKWVNPPSGTQALAWLVLKHNPTNSFVACGFANNRTVAWSWSSKGETQMNLVQNSGAGNGTYAASVARITIAIGAGPATEAVLRHGFYFAPMKYVGTPRLSPNTAPTYTIRGYDANGKLIYASPKTERELQAELDGCFTNPAGTKVVFVGGGRQTTPPVSQCKRGVAWNW
jgi:hypothetical protein